MRRMTPDCRRTVTIPHHTSVELTLGKRRDGAGCSGFYIEPLTQNGAMWIVR